MEHSSAWLGAFCVWISSSRQFQAERFHPFPQPLQFFHGTGRQLVGFRCFALCFDPELMFLLGTLPFLLGTLPFLLGTLPLLLSNVPLLFGYLL